jgi:hypothetical protein
MFADVFFVIGFKFRQELGWCVFDDIRSAQNY